MTNQQKTNKLKLNTLIDIEELQIRLKLKEDQELALLMLAAFRSDASLRQIKNALPLEVRTK